MAYEALEEVQAAAQQSNRDYHTQHSFEQEQCHSYLFPSGCSAKAVPCKSTASK